MKLLLLFVFVASASGQEVCCDGIGCFNDQPPFDHLPLPACPIITGSNRSPNFNLFTRSNRDTAVEITRENIPSQFDGSKRVVYVVHGWLGNRDTGWAHTQKNAILTNFDYNVIVVGWGPHAQTNDYPWAASNTRTIGAEIAFISNNLITQRGAAAARLWCIGHSLGSHVCGFFGKRAQQLFSFTPGRITGLDPALSMFDSFDPEIEAGSGLWNTDATFVDTIITDRGGAGTLSGDRGHANFYPNGGTGDHQICHTYMTESFSSTCRFNARQRCIDVDDIPGSCSECGGICQVMGEPAEAHGGRGLFYLTTNGSPPHCQG